jgi:hypothetical protein
MAQNVRFGGFSLRLQGMEGLLQSFFRRLARIDRTAQQVLTQLGHFFLRPKK